MMFPLVLLCFGCVSSLLASPSMEEFSQTLKQSFEYQARASILQEDFEELRNELKTQPQFPQSALTSSKVRLTRLFNDRINALKSLVRVSEEVAAKYEHDTADEQFFDALPQDICDRESFKINESDVHFITNSVKDTSGVHVNIESYSCDNKVRRDFRWTGDVKIEKKMKENKALDGTIGHQFIGTYSGLTRMYPRRKWEVEPSQITIDLYDPRFRPWFINAETTPKDIVFLIDYSGSVKGPTMHLIKITLMYILSTLSPNDHFYGVYFNSGFAPIIGCHNNTFLSATTVHKKLFFERLAEIEVIDQAHLERPLKFSLDVLRNKLDSNSTLFANSRSGGQKMIMLFTDGIDEWPTTVLEEELEIRGDDPIRIFGFSMGYGTGQISLLHWMACNTFAAYSVVDSIMDVKPQSRVYLDMLSTQNSRVIEDIKVEDRNVSWTNLYMEAQGLGPTITVSMPVLNRNSEAVIWTKQGLAGVAGIDISISDITNRLPSGEQLYSFVVDDNGMLITHPKLIIPKTEIHCIRRSACYDATQVRHKAGSGLRVQYGFSDQRVYRLVGLIDSIPTIDIMKLEGNSTAVHTLRHQILHHSCKEEAIPNGDSEYFCAHLDGTPFSVVIVNFANRETIAINTEVQHMNVVRNPLVTYFSSKRDTCGWKLDAIPVEKRFEAIEGLSDCEEDLSLTKQMVNTVHKWAQSWPQSVDYSGNISCEASQLPKGFSPLYFVNSFVHLRPQVTVFYPSCVASSMKPLVMKFDQERLEKDNSEELQVTVRNDVIIAYQSINDKNNNRLATVGVQWRHNYIDSLFRNFTRTNELWNNRCKKKDCLVVTRSAYVIASNTKKTPNHLAVFDPQLFQTFHDDNMIKVTENIDAQAECAAKMIAPWSSSASKRGIMRSVIDFLVMFAKKTFWFDVYWGLTGTHVAAQPSMHGGICRFQKIKPVERCFLRHTHYRMTLNITKQMQLKDLKCSRFAKVYPITGTFLTMVETDRACSTYKTSRKYATEPEKLDGCEKIVLYERRKRSISPNYTMLDEDLTIKCLSQDSTRTSMSFYLFTFAILFIIG